MIGVCWVNMLLSIIILHISAPKWKVLPNGQPMAVIPQVVVIYRASVTYTNRKRIFYAVMLVVLVPTAATNIAMMVWVRTLKPDYPKKNTAIGMLVRT